MSTTDEQIREAAGTAAAAFFSQLARTFPEAVSGDLAHDADDAFRQACEAVAREWVAANVRPIFTHDQLATFGRIADLAGKGDPGDVYAIRADVTEAGNMAVEIRSRGRGEGYAFGELVAPDGSTLDRVELHPSLRAADVLESRVDD